MAHKTPPAEPLVVVLGTTGTGKSNLAVDLACRFNGEVINADAMQMYRGLPIITNKISVEEQRGVSHHLLGNIGLDEPTWTVHQFRREARRIIREIRSRGRLPIVVGGSHYYTDGLLFDGRLVGDTETEQVAAQAQEEQEQQPGAQSPAAAFHDDVDGQQRRHLLEDAPTETLYAKLREVDPVMADCWHPKDRRKIWRSLEIYLTTGRRASDIYAEQRRQRDEAKQRSRLMPWDTLLFWVYSRRDILDGRLDRRVDAMLERGLIEETRELHEHLRVAAEAGDSIDRTLGIWQSIGFAQMEPYLDALRRLQDGNRDGNGDLGPEALEALRRSGIEAIKGATRRYAKYQNRWIKFKTIPRLQDEEALGHLFLLDSTDASHYTADVADKAATIAERYLAGDRLPAPEDVSETAAEVLQSAIETADGRQMTPRPRVCDVCKLTFVFDDQWEAHIKGNRHKRAVKAAQRRAIVATRGDALAVVEAQRRGE